MLKLQAVKTQTRCISNTCNSKGLGYGGKTEGTHSLKESWGGITKTYLEDDERPHVKKTHLLVKRK